MKKKLSKIEQILEERRIRGLSDSEREMIWQRIASTIERKPVPSPWFLPTNKFKPMIPLMIAAVMFLGVGGTAALADNSKPGDALFGIDRASEEVRIAFASKAKSADLKARFALERLSEVEALVANARLKASASTTATTTATTTPPSRADKRVGVGVNVAISYLNKISADLAASGNVEAQAQVQNVITRLEAMINVADVKVNVKNNEDFKLRLKGEAGGDKVDINTNGNKSRIEVREDGNRIRIELKDDGLLNIKTETRIDTGEDSDDDEDSDDEDEDEEDEDKGRGRGLRIDAGLF